MTYLESAQAALDKLGNAGLPGFVFELVEAQLAHDGGKVAHQRLGHQLASAWADHAVHRLARRCGCVPAGETLGVTARRLAFPISFFL